MNPNASGQTRRFADDEGPHTTAGLSAGEHRGDLLVSSALLLGGVALCWLPGSFPPGSWVQVVTWLVSARPVALTRWLSTGGQAVLLLVAWLAFLLVVWRARGWWWPKPREAFLSSARFPWSQEAQRASRTGCDTQTSDQPLLSDPVERGPSARAAPALASAGQTVPLEALEGPGSRSPEEASPVSLLTTQTAFSTLAQGCAGLSSPSWTGLVEVPLDWPAGWQEGIGWQVAACCRQPAEEFLARQEDGLLAAVGLRHWPDQHLRVGPVGLLAVADGRLVERDQEPLSTSRLIIEALGEHLAPDLFAPVPFSAQAAPRRLLTTLEALNGLLSERLGPAPAKPVETALCVVLLLGATAFIANVGDCRAYLYRQNEGLLQMTADHRVSGDGKVSADLAGSTERARPPARQLYRSLGRAEAVEVDVFAVHVQCGDLFLLCSDGFWSGMAHEQLVALVEEESQMAQVSASRLCTRLSQQIQPSAASGPLSLIIFHFLPLLERPAEEPAPVEPFRGTGRRERRRKHRRGPPPPRPPVLSLATERSQP